MKVFVYGSLKKGKHNHRLLENANLIGRGIVKGECYSLPYGFPALIDGDRDVIGEVYDVTYDELYRLDRLEGYRGKEDDMYKREKRNINMDGIIISAYTYIWNNVLPLSARLLESGEEWK